MDEHLSAREKNSANFGTGDDPALLEPCVRNGHIHDRQVKPFHATSFDFDAEVANMEQLELMILDQGHDSAGAPPYDFVEISGEDALPSPAPKAFAGLAGAERDPDQAAGGTYGNLVDAQGVGRTGSDEGIHRSEGEFITVMSKRYAFFPTALAAFTLPCATGS